MPNSIREIDLFVNMEPQKTSHVGYQLHNRGLFYIANEITYQYERIFKNSEYDKLRKCVCIFISFDAPTKEEENSMTIFQLSKNVKIGYNKTEKKDYDKIQVIIIYLGREDTNNPLFAFLKLLFRSDIKFEEKIDRLRDEHDVHISDTFKQEVEDMCGLGDLVEKRGIEIGIERGQFDAILAAARNIMNDFHVDKYQALKSAGAKEKDYPIYLEALKENIE